MLQLAATPQDSSGNPVSGRVVTWASSNPAVATVTSAGLVTGQAVGSATITATSEGKSGSTSLTIQAPPPPGSRAGYYVTPSGLSTNSGGSSSPWSLSYALGGAGGVIQPGDTVWLRGGTYSGSYTSGLNGTSASPIVVRQYPGERATLSGNLAVYGSYTWFWGFEVVSPSPGASKVNGVQSRSTGAKYINLVVHDAAGVGITLYDDIGGTGAKPDQEAYGCISYNNGNANAQAWDHGIYAQNVSGYRSVRDNIVFNNTGFGIQFYGTGNNLHNDTADGNIIFNNGSTSTPGYAISPADLEIGGGQAATGAVITNNYIYRAHPGNGDAADIGYYFGPINQDLVFTGNYIYGLTEIRDWVTATITGNTVYNVTSSYSLQGPGLVSARGNLSGYTWSGNTWYGDAAVAAFGYGPAGQNPGSAYNYALWLAATGLTNPGTFAGSIAPNRVAVRPNAYEAGRANIVVYNWALQSTVSVDVSGVLQVGDRYVVQNVQDFYGTPVASGTYTGGALPLPMAGIAPPNPIGRGQPGPTTGPTFNAFVLMQTP
jgi:hypothetical protein